MTKRTKTTTHDCGADGGRQVTVKYAGYTKTDTPVPFQPVAKLVVED